MAGHKALADTMAARGGPTIVEDTDALQTLVWAEAVLGKVDKPLVDWARAAVVEKTYLLLDHATSWEDDGTRHFADPVHRAWFTGRLRFWLDEFGVEWKCIEGEDWAERTAAANVRLDALS
jgi:nicotinamide riboside kinase